MIRFVEEHIGFIMVFFSFIFVVELGIGAWRLPKEFRHSIIPRVERIIAINEVVNERLDSLEIRVDLLSEIEMFRIRKGIRHDKSNF